MGGTNTTNIAFIGFGEVGQTFARGLLKHQSVRIAAYDALEGTAAGVRLAEHAAAIGVTWCSAPALAVQDTDFIISAVTASQAEAVAALVGRCLKPGQIFVDVNSAAPSTKQRAAQSISASGAAYVEAAVMAPVLKPGLQVPILSGGPLAVAASERLNAFGMNLKPVSDRYGIASAMKLCRSIMIKGLEALMVDCAEASERWGVKDEVFASLHATFPSIDFHALADDMRERVATHGVRRAAEMAEAGEMLAALGMNPDLAKAVSAAQLRRAKSKSGGVG
jgi:3-hydroxyisobutyrate dehydrogenase-like beta-hydroxyacid dehydrogenase